MKKLVIDVGGTFIKYALMDMDCVIYDQGKVETPIDTKEHFLDAIESIYNQYKNEVDGMAFSLPGNINVDTGDIYTPGALLFNVNTNFFESIHSRIDINVSVENDGKCAALAELWKGHIRGYKNGAVMVLGTGIGGGLICDGKLLKGNHFFAGELSFLIENPMKIGLENVFAMNGSATALCLKTATKQGNLQKQLNGKDVFQMIEQGDSLAIEALEEVAQHVAVQIFNTQCFIDPDIVCIGGGISQQPLLIKKIKEHLEKIYQSLPVPVPRVEVKSCQFHNDSNLIGALYNYQLHFQGEE